MTEQGSQNQEEPFDNQNPIPELKPETPKNYNAEQEELVHRFFKFIEPYELMWYQDRNIELPTELDERFMRAFEHYHPMFYRFANDLIYGDKVSIYTYLLKLLEFRVYTAKGTLENLPYRTEIRRHYDFVNNEYNNLTLNSKFKLTWNREKANAYLLPILIQALCDENIILESKEEAYKAFQSIFPDEKLSKSNIEGVISSTFSGKQSVRFENALIKLLTTIKKTTIAKLDDYRIKNDMTINENR